MWPYISELLNVLLGLHKKYSPVFRIWIMGFPEVFITDPDDVEVRKVSLLNCVDFLILRNYIKCNFTNKLIIIVNHDFIQH